MSGQLIVLTGADQGKTFSIEEGKTVLLGRGQQAEIKLIDPHLSRSHVNLTLRGKRLELADLGSTSGTYVGNEKIEHAELEAGAVFRVGGVQLRFQSSSATDASTVQIPGAFSANAPLKSLVGQTINKYHLESVLSEGSSSTVFKATDTESGEKVALKILTPDLYQSDEQKERFVRAMKAMMPIHHPNIVRILMAGKSGPYCWTAMQYVDGESLEKLIEHIGIRGMLDWTIALRVAVDISRALAEAYDHKIVHRNLTPANILRRHADKVCLLGDLMLAKATEGALAKQVTRAGQIIGNLSYLPPECTEGGVTIDHRADLYGLGATLYALLTGRPPFESKSMPELVRLIRDAEPRPPREYQLGVNEGFEKVVLELLQKRPEDRYQTPQSLLRDLERVAKYAGQKIS